MPPNYFKCVHILGIFTFIPTSCNYSHPLTSKRYENVPIPFIPNPNGFNSFGSYNKEREKERNNFLTTFLFCSYKLSKMGPTRLVQYSWELVRKLNFAPLILLSKLQEGPYQLRQNFTILDIGNGQPLYVKLVAQ